MGAVLQGNPGVVVKEASFLAVDPKLVSSVATVWTSDVLTVPIKEGPCPCGCGWGVSPPPLGRSALADRKRQALEWVNMMRSEWLLPALEALPKGRRHLTGDCVLARALPRALSITSQAHLDDGRKIPLPAPVCEFVGWFDRNYYPELVL